MLFIYENNEIQSSKIVFRKNVTFIVVINIYIHTWRNITL